MSSSTRVALGIAAAGLIVGGVALMSTDSVSGGVLLRSGLVLGAIWLTAPLWGRPGPAALVAMAALIIVLVRPRLVFVVILGAAIWRFSVNRRRVRDEESRPAQ